MYDAQKAILCEAEHSKGRRGQTEAHLCNLKSISLYVCAHHDNSLQLLFKTWVYFLVQVHPIQRTRSLAVCSKSKPIFLFTLLFTI